MFQWVGGLFFRWGASFLSEEGRRMVGRRAHFPPTMGNPDLLIQSTVSRRSDLGSEANSNCCPQIRCLITFKVENSIISIDRNIIDNFIRKVINVKLEKCSTNNGPLRNSS